MPQINYNLIPAKTPGTLFSSLSGGDQNLAVRYFVAAEPLYYEVLNRPLKDLEVRQMVIAKAIDTLQLSVGSRFYFPFLTQPRIIAGTTDLDLPTEIIWDMHMSFPESWDTFRLAKILRISGGNGTTGYTGTLRFIFTASRAGSSVEVATLYADYVIDSDLTYQLIRMQPVLSGQLNILSSDERAQFSGFLTFLTLDVTNQEVQDLFDTLAPPANTATDSLGFYLNPATYEIADSIAGGTAITGDFDFQQISHGTGLLTDSALNTIPSQTVSSQGLLNALNYPFDGDANLISVDGVQIPAGLFSEFDITAPAGDEPTGDSSGLFFPVWVNRIQRLGTSNNSLRFYFATYNVTDDNPIQDPVEFAILDLLQSYGPDRLVEITPINNLKNYIGTDSTSFNQHFGRGLVKLSNLWDGTNPQIDDLYNSMAALGAIDETVFTKSSSRLGPLAVDRASKYIPTIGQSEALAGTIGVGRRTTPLNPNDNNRYVVELDEGLGAEVDLEAINGVNPNTAIERLGYAGSRVHKSVFMCVDQGLVDNSDPAFYTNEVLPRLRALFGRDPIFMDFWYDGSRLLFFNGDTWQSP